MRDYSKLLKLAKENNGIIQTKMAVENNISKHYLRFAVQDKVLEKVRNGIYITPETMEDELYILDQHAAHERIMYEKVKANYYSNGEKDSQLMLLPDIINLSTKEMGIFKDNKEMFNKAGFVVDEFGDNTLHQERICAAGGLVCIQTNGNVGSYAHGERDV